MKSNLLNKNGNLLLELNEKINESEGLMKEIIISGTISKLEELNIKDCWIENCIKLTNNEFLNKLKVSPLFKNNNEEEAKMILNKFETISNLIQKNKINIQSYISYFYLPSNSTWNQETIYSENQIHKLSKSIKTTTKNVVKNKMIVTKKIGISILNLQEKIKVDDIYTMYNDESFMLKYLEYVYLDRYKKEIQKMFDKHKIVSHLKISECKRQEVSNTNIPEYYFEVNWEYDINDIISEENILCSLFLEFSIICQVMLDLGLL